MTFGQRLEVTNQSKYPVRSHDRERGVAGRDDGGAAGHGRPRAPLPAAPGARGDDGLHAAVRAAGPLRRCGSRSTRSATRSGTTASTGCRSARWACARSTPTVGSEAQAPVDITAQRGLEDGHHARIRAQGPQGRREPSAAHSLSRRIAPAGTLSWRRGCSPISVIQKLDALPAQPGVYLFKDKKDVVVYVGKAKSLRVARAELLPGRARRRRGPSSRVLQRTIGDLETIVTATEKEATILENNLIKEHRPRYNVKLRDDKDFITLRLAGAPARRAVAASGARAPAAAPVAAADERGAGEPRRGDRATRARRHERRRVAPARGRAPADAGRRALLRPVPLGDRGAAHAAPREQALPAPHVQRRRVREPAAPVPAAPDQALPGAVRARGRPRVVRRAGRRGRDVPRRPSRRALARARRPR